MTVAEEKAALRGTMRERLRSVRSEDWAAAAAAVDAWIGSLPEWKAAEWVGAYAAMPGELDVDRLVARVMKEGRRLAMPGWDADRGGYGFREVVDPVRDLVVGRFGIQEPAKGCAWVDVGRLDFVLVPGIAFDVLGGRLGRGKGFYDRLLAGTVGVTCGVGADVQCVASVPMEPHDVRMNLVTVPRGCYRSGATIG
jgi:5-formyltetrahydrofolate cyclo-ligase